jgi:hypothetical protein
MKMSEESNSKQPNPNTMLVPKTVGVTMARAGGWWSFAAPWRLAVGIQRGQYSTGSDE